MVIILKVYVDDLDHRCIEVPVSPETTCSDVVSLAQEPGGGATYCLVQIWKGQEQILKEDENIYEFLKQWNDQDDDIKFVLRRVLPGNSFVSGVSKEQGADGRGRRYQNEMRDPAGIPNGLPGGVDLTLSELQDMASRQQQQIEHQQQVLVAKEQRLKYLKQQEARHQHIAAENDRLKKLREKVENQEMKLKKLRALRGEAEKCKNNNGSINSELESVKSLFSEKEKELVMAVAKVEELTRQLEEIRHDKESVIKTSGQNTAKLELDKLKKELMMRNKLNEEQNSKLKNHRDMLKQRKEEISKMDNRIMELQQRLKRKRAQQADQSKKQNNQPSDNNSANKQTRNNVAAVEPYVQIVPKDKLNGNVDSSFHKMDPKYQSLPVSSKFVMNSSEDLSKKPHKVADNVHEPNNNTVIKAPDQLKTPKMDSTKSVPKENGHTPIENVHKDTSKKQTPPASQSQHSTSGQTKHPPSSLPQYSNSGQTKQPPPIPARAGTTNLTYFTARPFGSTYSTSVLNRGPGDQQGGPTITIAEDVRTGGSGQSSPASSDSSLKENSAYVSDHPSTNHSEKRTSVLNGTNTYNTTVNNGASSHQGGPNKHPPPYPGGSLPPNKPQGAPPPYPHVQQNVRSYDQTDSMKDTNSNNGSDSSLNSDPGNSSKQQPKYKYASKNVIANTYMGKLGPEALKKYQQNIQMMYTNISKKDGVKVNKSNGDNKSHEDSNQQSSLPNSAHSLSPPSSSSSESPPVSSPKGSKPGSPPTSPQYPDIASDKVSHNRHTHKHVNLRRRHSDSDNEDITKLLHKYVDRYKNQSGHTPQEAGEGRHIGGYDTQATSFQDQVPEDVPVDGMGNLIDISDKGKLVDGSDESKSPVSVQVVTSDEPVLRKKTNLKSRNAKKSGNRVSFDPLALLLDSSLEGELELVKRCASQVRDVSEPNDEGITALHNAICAGHYEIVKFLVEFGCDVNSPDSDGWTPLHCAASCNNLPMVKFLVEHGACIFATTISDQETAAEKCEEEEDGFDGCSEYLYSIQEKLGILNNGATWAVFDYEAVNSDELSFIIGDKILIIRKGDEKEKEWWWSKLDKKEGYIPRNLLGLYPRVIPQAGESDS
ncbi:apoptosis-stimulating of p53 protein 2-like [Ylistrum balloti]|uniref:apoptosis-stimulating of p53 protein 2-like n=1 Tax=Ylistrum balloti TaxID=509963 RepID=UPI00290598CE|nr:apoptosis-stimulating of p53 protein 2-like [Ylistrum balloti]